MTYRTGRKVGRTIYHQIGDEPSDDDELVGLMDTPEIATEFVMAANNAWRLARGAVPVPPGGLSAEDAIDRGWGGMPL